MDVMFGTRDDMNDLLYPSRNNKYANVEINNNGTDFHFRNYDRKNTPDYRPVL